MADPFATRDDLELAWRPLTDEEWDKAKKLIEYASRRVRREFPGVDDRITAGTLDPLDVEMVVVGMVKRAMINSAQEGVTQQQQTAGPFSVGTTLANPNGNLYFTADDLGILGIGRAKMGTIRIASGYPPIAGTCGY